MKGFLNQKQIDYILFHLGFLFELNDQIRNKIVFVKDPRNITKYEAKIVFCLSDKKLLLNDIKWIDGIPIIFPISDSNIFYQINNKQFLDPINKSSLSRYIQVVQREFNFHAVEDYNINLEQYYKRCFSRDNLIPRGVVWIQIISILWGKEEC